MLDFGIIEPSNPSPPGPADAAVPSQRVAAARNLGSRATVQYSGLRLLSCRRHSGPHAVRDGDCIESSHRAHLA